MLSKAGSLEKNIKGGGGGGSYSGLSIERGLKPANYIMITIFFMTAPV